MTKEEETYPDQRIYERDNFKCRYCGWDGLKDFDSWFIANFNIDHITPKSRAAPMMTATLLLLAEPVIYTKESSNATR
jgi:hypothetical protein